MFTKFHQATTFINLKIISIFKTKVCKFLIKLSQEPRVETRGLNGIMWYDYILLCILHYQAECSVYNTSQVCKIASNKN